MVESLIEYKCYNGVNMTRKIAIINQRYGLEVNGGSELYTRQIAERLAEKYEVEVLTSCALDYEKWTNHYKEGEEIINNVVVRRFKTLHERSPKKFVLLDQEMHIHRNISKEKSEHWIDEMGPYCPELIEYAKNHKDEYRIFIVVTYLYYTAVRSMPEVADKAIFIPTAHQEPYIDFKIYKKIFELPKAYIFLTDEERNLVMSKFDIKDKPQDVMGVGIDVPEKVNGIVFKEKYKLDNYLIYVGRIDLGKDCPRMFEYFIEYKKRNSGTLKLVLMGKAVIDVPKHPDIINLGFVSDEDKFNGIKGAKALVLPSKYESLSISVLEAMRLSVPVIVNGRCDVLRGHCIKSNGGLYYSNYFEFEGSVNYMLSHNMEYQEMQQNALSYVNKYFDWKIIMEKFDRMIELF